MRQPDFSRRVVVTGLGVVSPVGNDKDTAWNNLVNGVSGLTEITKFDTSPYTHRWAGEVQDFDAGEWMDAKAIRRSEPTMWYGVAAAKQAVADSGLEITDANREDIGVVYGTGAGGQTLMIENGNVLREKGPGRVAPTFIANGLVDSTSGMIAIETGAHRPQHLRRDRVLDRHQLRRRGRGDHPPRRRPHGDRGVGGDAAARGRARRLRQHARARAPRVPASRSPTSAARSTAPATASSWARAPAALILEDLEYAKARGAHIYAEVVGYGSAADGWDMIQPIEHGTGAARAMQASLDRRGVPADEVDLINPHGTSTPMGDKREAEAIWTVFGDRAARDRQSLLVSGTKSMTGHMMGAAGAFEAFATVMSVAEQVAPPTLNYREFDPEADLWVCAEAVADADPLRPVEQHRPRRPQRRRHLQALGRTLTLATIRPIPVPGRHRPAAAPSRKVCRALG